MLCHVFLAEKPTGNLVGDASFGKTFWLTEKEIAGQNIMPGVLEVLKVATSTRKCLVFEEYSFQQV